MSSLAKEVQHPLVEVKCNTTNGSMIQLANEISDDTLINECLDALLFQNAAFRHPTHRKLKFIEGAKAKMSEANASLIEGIRMFKFYDVPFRLFVEAEGKGCKHPALYYFIGECYRDRCRGVDQDDSKAVEYYDMAIAGGCSWGLLGRYYLHGGISGRRSQYGESFQHLLEVEREGHIDGYLLNVIAERYSYERSSFDGKSLARVYYQRAIDYGYAYAAVNLYRLLYRSSTLTLSDKGVLLLLEAENKGLGIKDDRILGEVVRVLTDVSGKYDLHPDILGSFKNKGEMALHYCDVLIQRRSPLGYENKANLYYYGLAGVGEDMSKAVSIREDAVSEGLADNMIFRALQKAYRYGHGVPINGLKVLEYCEKELQVLPSDCDILSIFRLMASVYETGMEPVKKDGRKVAECYERAFRADTSHDARAAICSKLGDIYVQGCDPVPPNGAKALEYYIKALEFGVGRYELNRYYDVIQVYRKGIPPIAQNLDIADDVW